MRRRGPRLLSSGAAASSRLVLHHALNAAAARSSSSGSSVTTTAALPAEADLGGGWPDAPAKAGDRLGAVDTPALLLDMDLFDRNCASLCALLDGTGVTARVHVKAHKCAALALRQLALLGHTGQGVCCQTVTEVEAMVQGGVRDILLTGQVVVPKKIQRLMATAKMMSDTPAKQQGNSALPPPRLGCLVDNAANVCALQAAAAATDVVLDCLVEVDVGQGRCGVPPGAPVVELAQLLEGAGNLRFVGIHAYHGLAQHIGSFDERRGEILGPVKRAVVGALLALETAGITRASGGKRLVVTGGGTLPLVYFSGGHSWVQLDFTE
jgi:D-serine deaminase-like pyridoxal phosphate-dependent protein